MPSQDTSRYQIDDILEEAQRKKLERLQQQPSSKPVSRQKRTLSEAGIRPGIIRAKQSNEETDTGVSSPAAALMPSIQIEEDRNKLHESKPPAEPPFPIVSFKPAVSPKSDSEEQKRAVQNDNTIKIYTPKSAVKKVSRTVLPVPHSDTDDQGDFSSSTVFPQPAVQKQSQDSKSNIVRPAEKDTQSRTDEDWEEHLRSQRKQKAENFHIHESSSFKLSGEEELNDPGEEPDVFEDEELDDYTSFEDTDAIRSELTYRRRVGLLKLWLTGILTVALIFLMVCMYFLKLELLNPVLFIGTNVFILGIVSLLNHHCLGDGISALFHRRATADSAAALTTFFVLIHTLIQILNIGALTSGKLIILAPAAAAILFLNALGKQIQIKRIDKNFQFVSYQGSKYAVKIVDNERIAAEIGRGAVDIGVPIVSYLEKTKFLSHYLECSFSNDVGNRAMRRFVPFILFGSIAVALIYGFCIHNIMNALTIFVSMICLSTPAGMISAINFPLYRAAKRTLRHGAMLTGTKAAEKFGEVHALAVDALDLFPSESVLLHGIKTFSGSRIDEAIMDAAAVSITAGGPLSSIFRRVIQNRISILPKVDSLVYEQDMGMSGWVGGRRVLIGNRRLLENHGVDVPSHDYEKRYRKDNRELVYLSTAGELSAMFVVSYTADESIAGALNKMCGAGITLLVRTCDPNITEDLICREFDLDSYFVEVMGSSAGRCYQNLTSKESNNSPAVLSSNGRLEGTAYGLAYCRRLYKALRLAAAVQIIGGSLGFALYAFLSLCTNIMLAPLFFLGYTVLWAVLSWITSLCCRV